MTIQIHPLGELIKPVPNLLFSCLAEYELANENVGLQQILVVNSNHVVYTSAMSPY